ncbi:hypothetical protein NM688_g6189 [Phlebia brevispora]|uniref:Uncharacterized protein n=1 Tax=Phlebia brevispora TaxID=194682 RepID=A0ACC1SIQ8_9APHY|nr:hypothetical protein NM688_g6189 [Phlebia brevispora]
MFYWEDFVGQSHRSVTFFRRVASRSLMALQGASTLHTALSVPKLMESEEMAGKKRQWSPEAGNAPEPLLTAPHPHPGFDFDDRGVVFRVQGAHFRVYRTVLCLHSKAFRDMITLARLPKPSDLDQQRIIIWMRGGVAFTRQSHLEGGDVIDGCPVVRVSDKADDLAAILRIVYNGCQRYIAFRDALPFSTVKAMITLGYKYEMEHIRLEGIRRLQICFPEELSDFHNKAAVVETYSKFRGTTGHFVRPIDLTPKDAIEVIILARTFNIKSVLPAAFYTAAQLPILTLVQAQPPEGGLSKADLALCLQGRAELIRKNVKWAFDVQKYLDKECGMTADNQSRKKRQRSPAGSPELIPSAYKNHPEFYLDDGNVVLIAGDTRFRVHKSILALNSAVFCDMVSLAQPPSPSEDEDLFDGCPMIQLSDEAEDLAVILRLMYNGCQRYVALTEVLPFSIVKAMITLGHKYEMEEVRLEGLRRLQICFPDKLRDFHEKAAVVRTHPYVLFIVPFTRPIDLKIEDAIEVIALARRFNIKSVLPAAFYTAAQLPIATLVQALSPDGVLSKEDLTSCLEGKAELIRQTLEHLSDAQEAMDEACGNCELDIRAETCGPDALRLLTYDVDLCDLCLDFFHSESKEWREGIWSSLPEIFKLD